MLSSDRANNLHLNYRANFDALLAIFILSSSLKLTFKIFSQECKGINASIKSGKKTVLCRNYRISLKSSNIGERHL